REAEAPPERPCGPWRRRVAPGHWATGSRGGSTRRGGWRRARQWPWPRGRSRHTVGPGPRGPVCCPSAPATSRAPPPRWSGGRNAPGITPGAPLLNHWQPSGEIPLDLLDLFDPVVAELIVHRSDDGVDDLADEEPQDHLLEPAKRGDPLLDGAHDGVHRPLLLLGSGARLDPAFLGLGDSREDLRPELVPQLLGHAGQEPLHQSGQEGQYHTSDVAHVLTPFCR